MRVLRLKPPTRFDRMLARAWWVLIMSVIMITALTGLLLAHRGLFDVFGARWPEAGKHVGAALGFGLVSYLLCRNRSDLIIDR